MDTLAGVRLSTISLHHAMAQQHDIRSWLAQMELETKVNRVSRKRQAANRERARLRSELIDSRSPKCERCRV